MDSKEKLLVIILACVNFTHIMDFMIMMPLGPQFMSLFHITPAQFGFAVSAYSIMAGISGFVSAFYVDRFDRKDVLMFAYAGFLVGTFACALAPTYFFLVAARMLAGLFGGMIGAQVLSIVGDTFGYERRASAMGILMTSFSFASVIGVPTGLKLATVFSWHAPFLLVGIMGLFVWVLIWWRIPPITKHLEAGPIDRNPIHILTNIFSSPKPRRALALTSVLMLGHMSVIPFITPALVGNAKFSLDHIFLIYLVGGACTIVSSPLVGKLADKRGKYPIFVLFALLSLIPLWFITNLWPIPTWAILAIAAMFFVFANGRMIPIQAMVSNVVPPQQRGSFMSINSSVQQLATGVAANLGGLVIIKHTDGYLEHYQWVGYFAITLVLITLYLAHRVEKG